MKLLEPQVLDEKFSGIVVDAPWDNESPLFMNTKHLTSGKSLRIRAGKKPVLVFLVGDVSVQTQQDEVRVSTGQIMEITPLEDIKINALEDSWLHIMRAWKKPEKSPYIDY